MATALVPPSPPRIPDLPPSDELSASLYDCAATALVAAEHDLALGVAPNACDQEPASLATSPFAFADSADGVMGIDGRVRMVVRTPDGLVYPGDLLEDILEYRQLRTGQLNEGQSIDEHRLADLEGRLRAVPRADGGLNVRAYHRFDVALRGKLRHQTDADVQLQDILTVNVSAGGVKLTIERVPPEGDAVWLMIPRHDVMVILPARVAWARGGAVGLMFAGAPSLRPLKGKRLR